MGGDAIYIHLETINLNQVCSKQAGSVQHFNYDPVNSFLGIYFKEFFSKIYTCTSIESAWKIEK